MRVEEKVQVEIIQKVVNDQTRAVVSIKNTSTVLQFMFYYYLNQSFFVLQEGETNQSARREVGRRPERREGRKKAI